jgi:predicted acyltransferase (DUF342 family)
LEGVDVSFSSFLCAREKNRLGSGEKVEALLEEGWEIEKKAKRGWLTEKYNLSNPKNI